MPSRMEPRASKMKVLSITAGIGLTLLSLLACGLFLIAIVDPAGTQMANDNDPFGPPPSRASSAAGLGISALIGVAGLLLVCVPIFRHRDSRHPAVSTRAKT